MKYNYAGSRTWKYVLMTLLLANYQYAGAGQNTPEITPTVPAAIFARVQELRNILETKNWPALEKLFTADLEWRGLDRTATCKKFQTIFKDVSGPIAFEQLKLRQAHTHYVLTFLWRVHDQTLPDSFYFKSTRQGIYFTGDAARVFGDFYYSPRTARLERFGVYLPPGYHARQRYPVIINLLGASEAFSGWLRPVITRICDAEIRTGRVHPYIGISPQGKAGGLWLDWPDGSRPTETLILEELIPHLAKVYPVYATGQQRAIQGLSNGGYAAFSYALRHPELFIATVSYAGALDAIHPAYPHYTPTVLVQNLMGSKMPRLFFTVGDRDELGFQNQADHLHALLLRQNIAHVYLQFSGGHHHDEWLQHLPQGLQFISRAFQIK
jgi:enterochelin esterase-like enzyme